MSIASEITRINTNIANSYTAINNKGGTLPATQNSNNLATAINSIPSGGSATLITKTITENGTYDAQDDNADGYSSVNVNLKFTAQGRAYFPNVVMSNEAKEIGQSAYHNATQLETIILSSSVKSIAVYAFYNCPLLNKIAIPSSVTNFEAYCFANSRALREIDLSAYTDTSKIPTLSNSNVFNGTPNNKIFYVANQEMLIAFTTATNWSAYASRFQVKGS